MAKQSKNEPLNLDAYDFGDEFDFDEFSLEPKPVKTKREAIERIGEGVWEGAKDAVKSPSFFREFIKKALPRGYGDMTDLLDQGATSVRELYNEGLKETKPLMKDVGRVIDKMMPASSKYLPSAAEKLLKNFADDVRDQPQVGVGANAATDLAVTALMADTFRYNVKEDTRREAKNDARETLRDTVANDRFNTNSEQLDGIRRSVVSMAAYQRRVQFGYHKKSLELQARQYFVAVDSLNEMKRANLRTSEMLSGILHNTSLPDLIKMKTSEKFKDMLRNKMMAGLQDGIFGQRNNFMQRLGTAFREQALGSLREFAGGVRDGITGAEMAHDSAQMASEMGMDKWRMGGNVLGGEVTKWAGKLAATKVGKKIAASTGRHAQALRRFGNRLQYGVENAPQIATDFSNTATDATSAAEQFLEERFGERLSDGKRRFLASIFGAIGDPLTDLAKGTIRRANTTNTQVKETGIGNLYQPTAFSNQAHKSIVEVIPGYLARIYQELQIQRTGDASIDLTQYDYSRGNFSATRAVRQAAFNRLFDEHSRNGVKYERNQLLELIDPRGELSAEQRKELADILMNDNLRGRAGYEAGRITNYTHAYNFGESQHAEEFAKRFQTLAEKNKATEGNTNIEFAARFRNVGRSAADRRQEIQNLLEVYPRDMLEDMGLIKPGSTEIDMAKVNAYFAGEQYQARGVAGMPGGGRRRIRQSGMPPPTLPPTDTAPTNSLIDEIKRLIEITEQQNSKPLVSDIKDILLAMQTEMREEAGEAGPSAFDRAMNGASGVAQATVRGARRLRRQASVKGRRFLNENQERLAEVRQRAEALRQRAAQQARRAQRLASVQAGRLRQRYQPQIDAAQGYLNNGRMRMRDMWDHRDEGVELLSGMLRQRWDQLRGRAGAAYDHLHSDEFRDQVRNARDRVRAGVNDAAARAQGVGAQLYRNVQQGTEALGRTAERLAGRDVFTEIKDILIAIRDRLEDGIITTGGVPPEGMLRRAAGGARRGISRLNMRISDLVKGGFGLVSGTARLGGRVANGLVGGGARLGWNVFKGTAGLAGDAVGFAVSSQYRRARGFVDIYVGNERKPRLYGRMLQEGNFYFDKESGKPIRRLRDITGDVVRKTEAGEELVLSADEVEHAWQKVGPVKKTLKALGVTVKGAYGIGKKIAGAITSGLPPVFRAAWWTAKKAWGLLDMAQDIFVKDRLDEPAMTAKLMRAGSYYSASSGKVIKRPSQIDGVVLISSVDGAEVVLTHDDIRKGLVDKNNKPIRTGLSKLMHFAFGNVKKVTALAMKVGKAASNTAVSLVKGGVTLGKTAVKAGVKGIGGAFDLLRGKNPFAQGVTAEALAKTAAVQVEQNSYLKEIRDLLRDRLPKPKDHSDQDADGDGIRDGSYEDQMKHKADEAKAKAAQANPTASTAGVGAGGGIKSLWDRLRGKKEDDGDTEVSVNTGNSNDDKSPRDARRSRRLARRPGGSWGTSKGIAGKAKFLAGKGWGLLKGAGKVGMGLLGLGGLGLGGVMAGAGSAIASGAAAVGGALAAGASAIAGVISAPVVLGALAVAAVGIGAYYGYKYLTRKKLSLLSRIRYTQYGFSPADNDHVGAVFGLEDKLKDAVIYSKDGAKLDPKRVDPMSLPKDFGIDKDDQEAMQNWIQWFGMRFKPVFLLHVAALKQIASDKWLSDVDSLEPTAAMQYLDAVRFPDGPYSDGTSPFKDLASLKMGPGDVRAIIQLAERELKKKAPGATQAGITAAGAIAAVGSAKAASTPVAGPQTPSGVSAKALTLGGAAASVAPAKGAQVMASGSAVVLESLGVDKLDGVDVVRLKTYGLVKMEIDKVRALQALEKALTPKLSFTKNVATWSGSVEQVVLDNGAAFGVDVSNDAMAANWISWFNQRFLPVFLNYVSLIKAQTGKDDPEIGKPLLKAQQAVDVATALYTTNTGGGSVWNVSVSPWEGYQLNTDVRSTDGNMQGLKDSAKAVVLAEPGGKGANQPTAGKSAANSQTPTVAKSTGFFAGIKDFWTSTKEAIQGSPNAKTAIPTAQIGTAPYSNMPSSMSGGREMEHPGRGTGGDINAIPKPQGNKSWTALKDTILAAAQMVGVDGKLLAAMASLESGFDYTVKAGTSSATGLFQFISSTWDYMLRKYGSKYGIAPGTPPTDPRANALMGAEYLRESVGALDGKIGRPLTDTDIYFSHFLGPGGAKKFLSADPNALGSLLMPKEAAANRSIFYSKNGGPLTVGQIYQLVNSRVRNKSAGLNMDGGESMVASSTPAKVKGDVPPATGAQPVAATSKEDKPTTAKPAFGIGMPGLPSDKPTPPPTASKPASAALPVAGLMAGFVPPTRVQDQVSAAQQQIEVRVANLKDTNEILNKSLEVQSNSLKALEAIRDSLAKAPPTAAAAAPNNTSSTLSSQGARSAPRQAAELPRPPVSVSRPAAPF